jgi:hypothetical protein
MINANILTHLKNNSIHRPDEEDIPDESEPDRYWLALIKEIKKRRKSNDHHHSQYHSRRIPTSEVFLKVEWFYRLDDFEKSNLVFQKLVSIPSDNKISTAGGRY